MASIITQDVKNSHHPYGRCNSYTTLKRLARRAHRRDINQTVAELNGLPVDVALEKAVDLDLHRPPALTGNDIS